MTRHQTLAATILAAFKLDADASQPEAIADTAAALLIEVADILRGLAPMAGELAAVAAAPDGTSELLAEVRNLICEIRAERHAVAEDRRTNNRLFRSFMGGGEHTLATGSVASGLPG